jgi:hypothetical protein
MRERETYPVTLEGSLNANLSRWLWLVKWLLAIPHYIVLVFLWLTFVVLTVVAFFAILITGRYPRGIFDFNVGVFRWTWRVAFYSYAALGTDRYPPFTLDDVPDYPARLHVAYPEKLSRGLVLVKWWLLAIPHYIVVGILLGEGGYVASRTDNPAWSFQGGLIGLLVLFAGVALLFTTRYPRGIFDFVLGLDRWVARVGAYVFLMRDEYPPFRLDQGGDDDGPTADMPDNVPETELHPLASEPQTASAATPIRERGTGGKVVLIVVGVIAGIVAFGLLAGGCALVAVDQTQRDDDGFLMSPSTEFTTPTYAIVSENADIDTGEADWALNGDQIIGSFLGTVRIRSESDRAVFVGIGPTAEVDRFLEGIEHDVVTELDDDDPQYSRRAGSGTPPVVFPGEQTFWVASSSGTDKTLEWEPENGDWRVVVMNNDSTRGVSADMSIGAELDSVLWIGIGLLIAGGLLAAGAALAITGGARGRRT